MEAFFKTLADAGPIGVLAIGQALAIAAIWIAWLGERKEHIANLKLVLTAMNEAGNAAERSNASREAISSALREIATAQLNILGKVERANAILENGGRGTRE